MKYTENLFEELGKNINLQSTNKDKVVITQMEYPQSFADKGSLAIGISSYIAAFEYAKVDCVYPFSKAHLQMAFAFTPNDEAYHAKFMGTSHFNEFTLHRENDAEGNTISLYLIDCGNNIRKAGEIYLEVMETAYGIPTDVSYKTEIRETQKAAGKLYKKEFPQAKKPLFKEITISYKLSNVPNVLHKLEKLVQQYNKKAEKKTGYEKITFDMDALTIHGTFTPKTAPVGGNFFQNIWIEGGQNGDMEGDMKAIRNLCGEIAIMD
ncbi:MAG TPA: hypothetical protein H9924_11630 [Candidatus Phocaeicola merdavium]|nr:hypothetical protein [Candidatus Phocaeicola merdavium]